MASWEKEPEGRLGGRLDVDINSPEGWTVCPVFSDGYCRSGYHHLPLFKGDLSHEVLTSLRQQGCQANTLRVLLKAHKLVLTMISGFDRRESDQTDFQRERNFCPRDEDP